MSKTQEALKMAIETLPELISQAQCEFDSQHKAYEGYPAMYYRYGYLKELTDDGTKTLEACKEALAELALEQMAQNAREIGLVYCKHGSDGFCKECAMEEIK